MYSPKQKLVPPSASEFNFPFDPYEIQKDLMNSVYQVIENKKIGIFESPTGTGKSLTLTCATLRWLLDHEKLTKEDLQEKIKTIENDIKSEEKTASVAADWITTQFEINRMKSELAELKKKYLLIEDYERKVEKLRTKKSTKKNKINSEHTGEDHSLNEDKTLFDDDDEDMFGDKNEEEYKDIKIFFCSRTHSQITQVIREVRKTAYADLIRCVSMASRQNLCIHSELRKLNSSSLINERCLDMAKTKSKVTSTDRDNCTLKKSCTSKLSGCPHKTQKSIEDFSENCLTNMFDIEDLINVGDKTGACPYYAARSAAKDAQLIMLPYQILLHRKTRLQSGIDLKNSIVIIDEAHNLLDAITNIYSTEINLNELTIIVEQVNAYKLRYSERFNTNNLLKINQIIFIIKRFIKMLKSQNHSGFRMLKTCEFMSEGEFFNINLYDLLQFCENSRFAQKLIGFAQQTNTDINEIKKSTGNSTLDLLKKIERDKVDKKTKKSLTNDENENSEEIKNSVQHIYCPIRQLISFWESLTECDQDGRILVNYVPGDDRKTSMKFILLNVGNHFEEIVRDARSIIIAGGTLQPTDELKIQLFKGYENRLYEKYYDHVVSVDAVCPIVVRKGPTNRVLRFNYATKQDHQMISELGLSLQNLCNVIPDGIICFFSSYDYLDMVYNHLQEMGFLEKIKMKKLIFREYRISLNEQSIDKLLTDYSNAIKNKKNSGAILFSVVNGRLSEGLNFSDELGRCVIIVGMPYPDKNSPELKERMNFIELTQGPGAGQEFYENRCMKAVNQCIGRSVRHIRDYASILLFDERYTYPNVVKKLPQWISRNIQILESFGLVQGTVAKFFRQKN